MNIIPFPSRPQPGRRSISNDTASSGPMPQYRSINISNARHCFSLIHVDSEGLKIACKLVLTCPCPAATVGVAGVSRPPPPPPYPGTLRQPQPPPPPYPQVQAYTHTTHPAVCSHYIPSSKVELRRPCSSQVVTHDSVMSSAWPSKILK